MNTLMKSILINAVWLGLAAIAYPQDSGANSVKVPFSDPSRPGTVKVYLISGSISIKGYEGKEVLVDAKQFYDEVQEQKHSRAPQAEMKGLKKIPNLSSSLRIDEESNVISISEGLSFRRLDLVIQVPNHTNLKLKTINSGDIKAEQVQGEIEVNNINGGVTLTRVSGSVVAHALNGQVKVNLIGVQPGNPMSFSSLNGNIDVSLPQDIKANLSIKSDNGDIFSDFDINFVTKAIHPISEESKEKNVKYRIKSDRTMRGTINGGGPEIQFKTFNGNIYIRKLSK
jgi:hypothetical protein